MSGRSVAAGWLGLASPARRRVAFLLSVALCVPPTPAVATLCNPALLFRDGFESGDRLAWSASAVLTSARATPDGPAAIDVAGLVVTYLRPVVGSDPAGFFVQAEAAGPALFVAVDPVTLTPSPASGDVVHFTIDAMTTLGGVRAASALSGFGRTDQERCLDALLVDVSTATDLVSALDDYESRLVTLSGSVTGSFLAAGSGFTAATIDTIGVSGESNLRLRLPSTLQDATDTVASCTFELPGTPLWRFDAIAEPSAWRSEDLELLSCPAPTVTGASAPSATSVVVTFDRRIAPGSVTANGAQFVFDNGLVASAAVASGREVAVTTSAQLSSTTYTVTVANSVTDQIGTGVGVPAAAQFGSFAQQADLRFNEINPAIGSGRDLIEFLVVEAGTVNGMRVVQDGSIVETLATFPDVVVSAGDLIVVHLNPAGATGAAPGSETTSKSEYPAATFSANYDGAWDFHGGATGLTFSNRVLRLERATDEIVDAVPFVLSTAVSPPAAFPGDLQALQAAGRWLPADCGGMLCSYVSTPTAVDVSVDFVGCETTPAGKSVARKPGMDNRLESDWNDATANSWGAVNP